MNQIVFDVVFVLGFFLSQGLYLLSLLTVVYLLCLPVNWVDEREAETFTPEEMPYIVLFYPVLKELESIMRTTMLSLARIDYPAHRFRVVAIPNVNDVETVASLRRIAETFPFLQIVEVPPTIDSTWDVVWNSWDTTEKAYWWHQGSRAGLRELPPKKTRQLIYAFYTIADELAGGEDFLVNYIDADSCPPPNHFKAAASGIRHFDVLQAQNIAGNLNMSMAASWHAFDHMAWDGFLWPHLSANGRQPFWVLGKGLFFKASDLVELGGFHPWITIEDPEVGMRFWVNGRRLGVIRSPLIEEVPSTLGDGITQRKRWVCGFFQSLGWPLKAMGMNRWQRIKARINFVPCLLLTANCIGFPFAAWTVWAEIEGYNPLPLWSAGLSGFNVVTFLLLLGAIYVTTWRRSRLVMPDRLARLWYFVRVNPLSLLFWWLFWAIPLAIGYGMFRRDGGLVWERTVKNNANHKLVRNQQLAVIRMGGKMATPSLANDGEPAIAGDIDRRRRR
ncbi:MAG TPA: glycosyl transferase [Aurantimonas coralicida]|uniref:Glycosyl transferase n=2 Tax=root TaxID=1 RepID=A0A9C9TGV0_9HYPH|nr:glycosyl transferase [Aurantimonas coralicida]HEU00138.1 glycosyl transferase [Aurantimonas coralicida]